VLCRWGTYSSLTTTSWCSQHAHSSLLCPLCPRSCILPDNSDHYQGTEMLGTLKCHIEYQKTCFNFDVILDQISTKPDFQSEILKTIIAMLSCRNKLAHTGILLIHPESCPLIYISRCMPVHGSRPWIMILFLWSRRFKTMNHDIVLVKLNLDDTFTYILRFTKNIINHR
jgi:hypothetical protein